MRFCCFPRLFLGATLCVAAARATYPTRLPTMWPTKNEGSCENLWKNYDAWRLACGPDPHKTIGCASGMVARPRHEWGGCCWNPSKDCTHPEAVEPPTPLPAECSPGDTDKSQPCSPKYCSGGKWKTMHIDCPRIFGFPCHGGKWVKTDPNACCEVCVMDDGGQMPTRKPTRMPTKSPNHRYTRLPTRSPPECLHQHRAPAAQSSAAFTDHTKQIALMVSASAKSWSTKETTFPD